MSERSAILFVTDKFPWPLDDGGQIRTYQILSSLSARFPVVLLSTYSLASGSKQTIPNLEVEIVQFPRRRSPWMSPVHILQAFLTKRPYPLPKNFSSGILDEICRRVKDGRVGAIHFNHLDAAQYVHWLGDLERRVKIVFDTHNVLTSVYHSLARSEVNWFYKTCFRIQKRKMRLYEEAVMRKCDRIVVCSEVERDLLHSWGVRNCVVVHNGVDTSFFSPEVIQGPKREGPPHLVFTGAMDYFPNAEGLRWFLRSVVPELDRRLLKYRLTIVGKNPPLDLIAKAQPGKLEFTGRVDDIRSFARSADLVFVPLQIGGGTRLKILEALSMELPVVSTRLGAEGLDLQDRVHLRMADGPSEMAEAITELCRHRDRACQLARTGYEKVRQMYDWRAVTDPLCNYYAEELTR